MFEVRHHVSQRLSSQRIGRVLTDSGRCTVMGFVDDQQVIFSRVDGFAGCRQSFTEQSHGPFAFDEVDTGDQAREVRPRIDMNASATTQVSHQAGIHDAKIEAELVSHLFLPLDLQ